MEEIDPNNPNLDGDFKALFQRRKERATPSRKPFELSAAIEENEETELDKQTSDPEAQWTPLVQKLHDASKNNNLDEFRRISQTIENNGSFFDKPEIRNINDGMIALHVALYNSSGRIIDYILKHVTNPAYLMTDHQISVRNTVSQKTCLHILVDSGDLVLIERLLEAIPDGRQKTEFLLKDVLMEVEGQRPRNLSAIHIAALRGHTDILDLLHNLGVDVNLTNNKHDTPALWAARGNHFDTMRRLIQLKANLNHQNDKGSTPLYWAVRYGFKEMVNLLVSEGRADIHQQRKLGLVSPVVLSAALGYKDILQILINSGADVNTRITSNQTALHYAASGGMTDIVNVLLENHADCDPPDVNGNTPLHLATKTGQHDVMEILCTNGANIDTRNKFGKTVWDMAMETEESDTMKVVVHLYRRKKRLTGRKLIFVTGKTPLHEAAMRGDIQTLNYLIQEGASPLTLDQHLNTFFHVAARENKVNILREYSLSNEDLIHAKNEDGDTSMHLATMRGHLGAVELLIKKSKLDIKNNSQYTALHNAVFTESASPLVVKILVENIVKNNNWSLIDAQDKFGNSALHVAAIRNQAEVIKELGPLNPGILNNKGDSPFHSAAKLGNIAAIDVMLEVFNKPGKGLDIDQQNGEGETLLHIAAKTGSSTLVVELIEVGADLGKKNKQGNTILHEMAEEIVALPSCTQTLLAVFTEIVQVAPVWWCIKHDIPRADDGSEVFQQHQRNAMIYLTSEVFNVRGYNVLAYCAKVGALGLFEAILNQDNVYRLSTGKLYQFDITNVTPDTVTERTKNKNKKISVNSRSTTVGVLSEVYEQEGIVPSTESYLDIITNMRDEVLATKFLDVTPIKQISENLFNAYQWIYIILFVVHIVFMGCLTAYSIPCVSVLFGTNSAPVEYTNPPTLFPFILFLVWPLLLIVFGIFVIFHRIRRRQNTKCDSPRLRDIPALMLDWLFNNLAELTAWLFSGLAIAWYVLYLLDNRNQVYVLSVLMVLGWMFTIVFTKGFQTVHAFSTMLSYIIIRDVTRFIIIYSFLLLGFGFAMHTLFQIPVSVATLYNSPWDSLFLTFNLLIGMGDLFDEDFDQSYDDADSSATFVKVVYLLYMMLGTIILLNLLIAMLSDTYNDIKRREGTTWRVRSVHMAIRLERWLPVLKKIAIKTGAVDFSTYFDDQSQRWILRLAGDSVVEEKEGNVNEITKALLRMEDAYMGMNERLDEIVTSMEPLLKAANGADERAPRPRTALRKRRSTMFAASKRTV